MLIDVILLLKIIGGARDEIWIKIDVTPDISNIHSQINV